MQVSIVAVQGPVGSPTDPPDDIDELRTDLKRQIDALIEEEREARPRRYLAGWEEFAAEAAKQRARR